MHEKDTEAVQVQNISIFELDFCLFPQRIIANFHNVVTNMNRADYLT